MVRAHRNVARLRAGRGQARGGRIAAGTPFAPPAVITDQSVSDLAQLRVGPRRRPTARRWPTRPCARCSSRAAPARRRDATRRSSARVAVARLLLVQGADPETVARGPDQRRHARGGARPRGHPGRLRGGARRSSSRGSRAPGASRRSPPRGSDPEQLRKMLLAIAEDVRVVLIKLAERVVYLRSITEGGRGGAARRRRGHARALRAARQPPGRGRAEVGARGLRLPLHRARALPQGRRAPRREEERPRGLHRARRGEALGGARGDGHRGRRSRAGRSTSTRSSGRCAARTCRSSSSTTSAPCA